MVSIDLEMIPFPSNPLSESAEVAEVADNIHWHLSPHIKTSEVCLFKNKKIRREAGKYCTDSFNFMPNLSEPFHLDDSWVGIV